MQVVIVEQGSEGKERSLVELVSMVRVEEREEEERGRREGRPREREKAAQVHTASSFCFVDITH